VDDDGRLIDLSGIKIIKAKETKKGELNLEEVENVVCVFHPSIQVRTAVAAAATNNKIPDRESDKVPLFWETVL
jgi:hypothetical protein